MKPNSNLIIDNRDVSSRSSYIEKLSGAISPYLCKPGTPNSFTKSSRIKKTKAATIVRSDSKDALRSMSDVFKVSRHFQYKVPYKVEETNIACSPRPNTAPFRARSLLSAARKLEVASPKEPGFKRILQEESTSRLYKGAGFQSPSSDMQRNPIFRFESLMHTDKDEDGEYEYMHKENQEFQDYTQSLYCLHDLNFDLELNYRLARNKEVTVAPRNLNVGSLYTIQEELKILSRDTLESLLGFSRSAFSERLDTYTKLLREILRNLRGKGLSDEAVVLELLWRVVIKFFDSSIRMHDTALDNAVELNRNKIKYEADTKKMESDKLLQDHSKQIKFLSDEIDYLKNSLEKAQKDREILREKLTEKDLLISKLTKIDERNETMHNMKNLLTSLNNIINETEDEQHKQIATMKGMTTLMNLATHTEKKPKVSVVETQTDLIMLPLQYPIPEVKKLIMSNHPFYELIKTAQTDLEFPEAEIREILYASIVNLQENTTFTDALLFKLAERYHNISDFKSATKVIYLWLSNARQTDIWCKIYYNLLGFSNSVPPELYTFTHKLLTKLEEISTHESTVSKVSLPELINLISRLFKTERHAALSILSSLSYKSSDFSTKFANMEYSDTDKFRDKLSSILCRVSLRLEKVKNHRITLEKADSSKSGICNI